ncbi:MAG: FAD-binding oxidoreductase [Anaerolineae bacterium]|nr:FAD-binding oxidoreductase [Anaerolineae bacterium]
MIDLSVLDLEQVQALQSRLRGQLLSPGDAAYPEACRIYNGMIDRHPALIVRCVDVSDVIAAVNFAQDTQLPLAIRGGGHNGAGLSMVNDGLVIDLSLIKGVHVDTKAGTVRVGGGCVWGDVDHATHPFGVAVPSGFISTTGVGGLTLGGGLGYLTRKYGLTIDNLLAVEIVLADGRCVTASADTNADLFWAIRGGGGNFGVVTSFLFKANPLSTVYGGPMFWALDQAPIVMKRWRDLIMTASDEINGWFGFHHVPPTPMFPQEHHLKKVCIVTWCYTGDLERAEEVFAPIRNWAAPLMDFVGQVSWPTLQSLFDALYPPGLQWYWRADFVKDISDQAVDLHLKYAEQLPTAHSTMHLYPINGAAQRVDKNNTAWSFRDANFAQVIVGVDPDPANNVRMIQWAQDYWTALHPHSAGGAYVNMMMEEGEDRVKAAYRDNYARLAAIKAKYDPNNLFHINQNIKPQSLGDSSEKG